MQSSMQANMNEVSAKLLQPVPPSLIVLEALQPLPLALQGKAKAVQ